jgi:cell division protein FtsB
MLIEFLRADIEQLTAENEMLQRELDSLTKGSDPTLH